MRCLYCGNELALLKKLTGGGEFCSEAHRQKYQEEYNRLALSRLLQAQPEPLERPSFEKPASVPARLPAPVEALQPAGTPIAVAEEMAPVLGSRPSIAKSSQPAPPAEPGFLLDGFEAVLSPGELVASEPYLAPMPPVLPRQLPEPGYGPRLHEPDSVALPDLQVGWNQASRAAEQGIDARDFARTAPLVRIPGTNMLAQGLAVEREPLPVVLHPSPSLSGTAWSAAVRDFEFRPAFTLHAEEMIQPLPVPDEELVPRALVEAAAETASDAQPVDPVVSEAAAPPENVASSDAGPSSDAEPIPAPKEPAPIEFLPPADPEAELAVLQLDAEPELLPEPEPAAEEPAPAVDAPVSRIPKAAGEVLPVILDTVPPPPVKPAVMNGFSAAAAFPITVPHLEPAAVRSKMIFGPRPPAAATEAAATAAVPAPAAPETEAIKPPPPASKRDQKRNGKSNGKSAPPARPAPEPVVAPPVELKPAEASPLPEPVVASPAARLTRNKPQLRPDETPASKRVASLDLDDLRLTLEHSDINSPIGGAWSRMNLAKRIAVSAGLLLALAIAGFLLKSSFAKTPPPAGAAMVEAVGPSLITGEGGWSVDWNGAGSEGRQISLFRPSLTLADYRIEFQGQIESKSIGWVFRAANPRNYYVTRIEMKTPGLNPTVVIVHYAVINGEETPHAETPLPFPVHIDTEYKVRTDVYGSHFNTYLQEKLVDSWSDDRLKSGGFGLSSERTDRPQIRRVQLFELRAGK